MKKILALVLALLMTFAFCSCTSNAGDDGEKTLVFGTSADYAPFEFMYPDENGDLVYGGIDVSVAQYIADYNGMTLRTENMGFDYLLASLQKGDFDIVIAAMEETEERAKAADFSDPYYTDYPAMILIKAENIDDYKTLADFAGKSVGAQTGTTKLDLINDSMPGATAVSIQIVTDLVNQLVYDKVDAVVLDGGVALEYANSNPGLMVADASSELGEALPFRVAVAKGDPKGLLPGINAAIAKMLEEGKMDEYISAADALSGVWQEVTAE